MTDLKMGVSQAAENSLITRAPYLTRRHSATLGNRAARFTRGKMQKARFLPIPSDLPLSLGLGSGLKLASLPGNLRTAMPSPYAASIRGVYCPTDEETEAQPDSKSLLVTAAELAPSSDPCEA